MHINNSFGYNYQKEPASSTGNIVRKLVATIMQFGADNPARNTGAIYSPASTFNQLWLNKNGTDRNKHDN